MTEAQGLELISIAASTSKILVYAVGLLIGSILGDW